MPTCPRWRLKCLLPDAPRETRTPTRDTPDKALNLARLPIPPQARDWIGSIDRSPGSALESFVPSGRRVSLRTHVRTRHRKGGVVAERNLTKRQQEVFDFIKRYSAEHGYPPTVRDIGKAIGLTSSSTVHAHLSNLERLGLLRRDPTKPRALELLGDAAKKALPGPSGLPLVGRVAAGTPILAEENVEDYVEIPQIAGREEGGNILRAPR